MNIFRMMAHSPGTLRGVQSLGEQILSRQTLSAKLREIAILRVARRSGATYEWEQHIPIAAACGVTQEQIRAVTDGDTGAACFDELESAVLAASDELLEGARLSDGAMASLTTFLSPAEIIELIVAVSFYMLIARFLESTGVEVEATVPKSEDINPRFT
jgi:alkylhydroperoxidase family enzyme